MEEMCYERGELGEQGIRAKGSKSGEKGSVTSKEKGVTREQKKEISNEQEERKGRKRQRVTEGTK